jgi:precorrin-6B methylase 2
MKFVLVPAALLLGAGAVYWVVSDRNQPQAQPASIDLQPVEVAPAEAAERTPEVVYVPTPPQVVDAMLEMAQVRDGDVLYDLGSGDGRIPIAAAKKFKVRAVGIDIDPQRINEARANAKAAGVTGEVTFRQEDLFQADFSDATVVTLYLLESLNQKLRPRLLKELKPGTRIVSHAFSMGDWAPEKTANINGSMIYLWTVPPRSGAAGN